MSHLHPLFDKILNAFKDEMKPKKVNESLSESPIVEFNLRAARVNRFFEQYELVRNRYAHKFDEAREELEQIKINNRKLEEE